MNYQELIKLAAELSCLKKSDEITEGLTKLVRWLDTYKGLTVSEFSKELEEAAKTNPEVKKTWHSVLEHLGKAQEEVQDLQELLKLWFESIPMKAPATQ